MTVYRSVWLVPPLLILMLGASDPLSDVAGSRL